MRLKLLPYRQPSECCRIPAWRNSLPRGVTDQWSSIQLAIRTNVTAGFWHHISCDPQHQMFFKLFGWSQWHSPTRQWTGMQNCNGRRGLNSFDEWRYDHPAPCLARTFVEEDLVSIGTLAEDGYMTTLGQSFWQITRGNLIMNHGSKYNNLYLLNVFSHEGSINVAELPIVSLWHGRLCHCSQAGLDQLTSIGYIPKLQHSESNFSVNTGSRPEAGTRLSMRGYTLTLRANSQRYLRIDAWKISRRCMVSWRHDHYRVTRTWT